MPVIHQRNSDKGFYLRSFFPENSKLGAICTFQFTDRGLSLLREFNLLNDFQQISLEAAFLLKQLNCLFTTQNITRISTIKSDRSNPAPTPPPEDQELLLELKRLLRLDSQKLTTPDLEKEREYLARMREQSPRPEPRFPSINFSSPVNLKNLQETADALQKYTAETGLDRFNALFKQVEIAWRAFTTSEKYFFTQNDRLVLSRLASLRTCLFSDEPPATVHAQDRDYHPFPGTLFRAAILEGELLTGAVREGTESRHAGDARNLRREFASRLSESSNDEFERVCISFDDFFSRLVKMGCVNIQKTRKEAKAYFSKCSKLVPDMIEFLREKGSALTQRKTDRFYQLIESALKYREILIPTYLLLDYSVFILERIFAEIDRRKLPTVLFHSYELGRVVLL